MTTFLDAVTDVVTPELASVAALAHGAPPESMERALRGAVVTVLGAMAQKAGDVTFTAHLHQMVLHSSADVAPRSVIDSVAGAGGNALLLERGVKMAQGLFGQSGDTVAGMIGKMAGLPDGTALLGHAAAMALAIVGARVRVDELDAVALATALHAERVTLRKAMPGAVAGLLRISEFATASHPVVGAIRPRRNTTPPQQPVQPAPQARMGRMLLFPVIAALAAFTLLGWAYLRR